MSTFSEQDHSMMRRALRLARRGRSWVAPNPMVGAVVVRDGEIVGEGYHQRFGGPHAEVHALENAGERAKGADLYVTLEPCCHFGKTPPCSNLVIEKGIKRVFAAIVDPNPLVNGRGLEQLRSAGLEVHVGLETEQARALNEFYLKKAATGKPWVTLKLAQTLDGRIATRTGHSQWITGPKARQMGHALRAMHDAILVGAGTVHADDPTLNVRHVRGRNPIRIVLDTKCGLQENCTLLNSPDIAPTWIIASDRCKNLPDWDTRDHVSILRVPEDDEGTIDLHELMSILGRRGVSSILVEGGRHIWTRFLEEGLVDKIEAFIAPMIMGEGLEAIGDLGVLKIPDAVKLDDFRWRRVGTDLHVVAKVHPHWRP